MRSPIITKRRSKPMTTSFLAEEMTVSVIARKLFEGGTTSNDVLLPRSAGKVAEGRMGCGKASWICEASHARRENRRTWCRPPTPHPAFGHLPQLRWRKGGGGPLARRLSSLSSRLQAFHALQLR